MKTLLCLFITTVGSIAVACDQGQMMVSQQMCMPAQQYVCSPGYQTQTTQPAKVNQSIQYPQPNKKVESKEEKTEEKGLPEEGSFSPIDTGFKVQFEGSIASIQHINIQRPNGTLI